MQNPVFAKKNRETILPSKTARFINDIMAVLLFASSLVVLVALATHNAQDACWSKSNFSNQVLNKMGSFGAYFSDIILYIFGYSAWWLVIGVFYFGYRKINRNKLEIGSWHNILQVCAFILLMLASSTFEYAITSVHSSVYLPNEFGGGAGSFIYSILVFSMGQSLTIILNFILLIGCFSMALNLSWLSIAEKIGLVIEKSYLKLADLVSHKEHKTLIISHSQSANNNIITEEDPLFNDSSATYLVQTPNSVVDQNTYITPTVVNDFNFVDESIFDNQEINLEDKENIFGNEDTIFENINLISSKSKIENIEKVSKLVVPPKENINYKPNAQVASRMVVHTHESLPPTSLLKVPLVHTEQISQQTMDFVSNTIQNALAEFGVQISIVNVESGPVITRYEFIPPKGIRGSKIVGLSKEVARSLALTDVRIVETIPGKITMGIEVPNFKRQTIYLKEIFDSEAYIHSLSKLTLTLGKDIAGNVIVTDLAKMPHLLVAGTTGSGKSVSVNVMILSILFKATPDEVKFIMIDPKMVELSFYQDIPHLLAPVVTDVSQAANALRWTVGEMERRYKIMAKIGTKNIISYNQKIIDLEVQGKAISNPLSITPDDPEPLEKWPYIVVVIDELADLMMVVGKKVEQYIARIAQKARAIGIHLIVATQRPSADVITGLIKSNIPSRISFKLASATDSRIILDQGGAEALLGQGDMLFLSSGAGFTTRVHGAFVNDDELNEVVEYIKMQGSPNYNEEILSGEIEGTIPGIDEEVSSSESNVEKDPIFDEAVKFMIDSKRCSISSLQTRFGIGYNKAARIMNQVEKIGMVRRTDKGTYELLNHAVS